MRARVIETNATPEFVEQGIQLTRDVLVPAARQQEGFRGYIAMYDAEQGTGIAVTLWEDERTEMASDAAATPAREQLAAAFGADLRVVKYDVAIVEIPNGA